MDKCRHTVAYSIIFTAVLISIFVYSIQKWPPSSIPELRLHMLSLFKANYTNPFPINLQFVHTLYIYIIIIFATLRHHRISYSSLKFDSLKYPGFVIRIQTLPVFDSVSSQHFVSISSFYYVSVYTGYPWSTLVTHFDSLRACSGLKEITSVHAS